MEDCHRWQRFAVDIVELERHFAPCIAVADVPSKFSFVQQFWQSLGAELSFGERQEAAKALISLAFCGESNTKDSWPLLAERIADSHKNYVLLVNEVQRFLQFATLNCFSVRQLVQQFMRLAHKPLLLQINMTEHNVLQNFSVTIQGTLTTLMQLIEHASQVLSAQQAVTSQLLMCNRCCVLLVEQPILLPCKHRCCPRCVTTPSALASSLGQAMPLCLACVSHTETSGNIDTQRRQLLMASGSLASLSPGRVSPPPPSLPFSSPAAIAALMSRASDNLGSAAKRFKSDAGLMNSRSISSSHSSSSSGGNNSPNGNSSDSHNGSGGSIASPSSSSSSSPVPSSSSSSPVKEEQKEKDKGKDKHTVTIDIDANPAAAKGSCHHCKTSKGLDQLKTCCTQPKRDAYGVQTRRCRKRFCISCLKRSYPQHDRDARVWICPACKGYCCCAVCKRRNDDFPSPASPTAQSGSSGSRSSSRLSAAAADG